MLNYRELQIGKTKVLLPNGCTGTVTGVSPIQTMKGGLLRGRDKVKVAYTTKSGQNEGWFQLRDLRTYKLVAQKVNTDIQPVEQGKESWKSENTFNGVQVIKGTGMTVDVIVPTPEVVELTDQIKELEEQNSKINFQNDIKNESLKGMDSVMTQKEYNELNVIKKDTDGNVITGDEEVTKVSVNDLFNVTTKEDNENPD